MTPHISSKIEDIAKIVIMPGDPLRAKFIAENFLENISEVNSIRNMLAFTGYYKGKRVTIMGSGMGMPSMGIYSYELFKFYDVESIIRVGSAGSYTDELNIYDVVLASSSWSESSFAKTQNNFSGEITTPSKELNQKIIDTAKRLGMKLNVCQIHSSDVFYREESAVHFETIRDEKLCKCVEMESFALFHNANVLSKKASCILTISDSLVSKEEISAIKRQNSFNDMIKLALESII